MFRHVSIFRSSKHDMLPHNQIVIRISSSERF